MTRIYLCIMGVAIIAACGGAQHRSEGTRYPSVASDVEHEEPEPTASSEDALQARYADRPALRVLRGRASYYHDSLAGNTTANGEVYELRAYTAASRKLAFGTIVRVVRQDSGRSVIVLINDRGPFGDRRRILDLSRAAAEHIDMIRAGVVDIRAEILAEPAD